MQAYKTRKPQITQLFLFTIGGYTIYHFVIELHTPFIIEVATWCYTRLHGATRGLRPDSYNEILEVAETSFNDCTLFLLVYYIP